MKLLDIHAFNCIVLRVKFGQISCEDISLQQGTLFNIRSTTAIHIYYVTVQVGIKSPVPHTAIPVACCYISIGNGETCISRSLMQGSTYLNYLTKSHVDVKLKICLISDIPW